MATAIDYAQLSGRVYPRTDENRTPVPEGWTELTWNPGSELSGFSAGVYQKGNEIVISYTGTNEKLVVDFLTTNLPVGASLPSAQVIEAMVLYLRTRQQYPDAQISFTGHSLGGGLASMMAVFFDRPATVFDAAPFELGARNLITLGIYQLELARRGYSDPAFNAYTGSIDFTEFDRRQAQVTGYSLEGEALAALRFSNTVIQGSETVLGIGTQSILGTSDTAALAAARVNLHSMTLLTAMMISPAFAQAVRSLPTSLEVFFDARLYARDPQRSVTPNLLEHLLRQHVGDASSGIVGNQMLDRIGQDLQRIAASGATGHIGLSKGLIAAVAEYYYFTTGAAFSDALTMVGNSVQLDTTRFATSPEPADGKGVEQLRNALFTQLSGDALSAGQAALQGATRFTVQSGSEGLSVALSGNVNDAVIGFNGADTIDAGSGHDVLIGLEGTDTLTGGAGADVLDGGADADTLNGGEGNDRLLGGTGFDTYNLEGNFGHDTLIDIDRNGQIRFGSGSSFAPLPAGQKLNDTTWVSADGQWTYVFTPNATTATTGRGSLYILQTGTDTANDACFNSRVAA